jgi:hypothetical protein
MAGCLEVQANAAAISDEASVCAGNPIVPGCQILARGRGLNGKRARHRLGSLCQCCRDRRAGRALQVPGTARSGLRSETRPTALLHRIGSLPRQGWRDVCVRANDVARGTAFAWILYVNGDIRSEASHSVGTQPVTVEERGRFAANDTLPFNERCPYSLPHFWRALQYCPDFLPSLLS